MAAIQANARQFLANSDYPFDKVIYANSGSKLVAGNTMDDLVTIPHGLPFTPLIGGNWSLVSDFSVSYDFFAGVFPSTSLGFIFDQTVDCYADATNIYIESDNLNVSSKTISYRIIAFEPSTSTAEIAGITSLSDTFIQNSGYNNLKLLTASTVSLPATTGTAATVPVPHNLGYRPQVLAWATGNSWLYPLSAPRIAYAALLPYVEVTTSSIIFTVPEFNAANTAHYRIYLDS